MRAGEDEERPWPLVLFHCDRCDAQFVDEPPEKCGRCGGSLRRLPDAWDGVPIRHVTPVKPTPTLVTAAQIRGFRARRPAGSFMGQFFGPTIPRSWLALATGDMARVLPWTLRAAESDAWQTPVFVTRDDGGRDGLLDQTLCDAVEKLEVTRTRFCTAASYMSISQVMSEHAPDLVVLHTPRLLPGEVKALRQARPGTSIIVMLPAVSQATDNWTLEAADTVIGFSADRWSILRTTCTLTLAGRCVD